MQFDLKSKCRSGLDASERRGAWLSLTKAGSRADFFDAALREVFGSAQPTPDKVFRIPFLGVAPTVLPESALGLLSQPSVEMSAAHDRVVCVLAQLHGLRYAPMVPNLALLLLSSLSEAEAYAVLEALVTARLAPTKHMHLSRVEEKSFTLAFLDFVQEKHPQLHAHLKSMGTVPNQVFTAWFRSFFVGWIPHQDVLRVVDAFLSEGRKVLFRFALAWLRAKKKEVRSQGIA